VAVRADSSNLTDLDRLYSRVADGEGPDRHSLPPMPVLVSSPGWGEITEEHYDKTFNTNVKGVLFHGLQKAPAVVSRRAASIILNASTVASMGTPAVSASTAQRRPLCGTSRVAGYSISPIATFAVNVVSPGPIATPGFGRLG